METTTYSRRSFRVQAIQLTEQNLGDVADWVGTEIRVNRPKYGDRAHVLIVSGRVAGREQIVPAFVGDWVTKSGTSFQRYTEKQFGSIFRVDKGDKRHEIRELVAKAMSVQSTEAFWGVRNDVVDKTSDDILRLF